MSTNFPIPRAKERRPKVQPPRRTPESLDTGTPCGRFIETSWSRGVLFFLCSNFVKIAQQNNFFWWNRLWCNFKLHFNWGLKSWRKIGVEIPLWNERIIKTREEWWCRAIWVFPNIGVPQNGWFIMLPSLLKWMIWGYAYFRKHPYDAKRSTFHPSSMSHIGRML